MANTNQINRTWVSLGIPFLSILVLVLLTRSAFLVNNPSVGAFAITFDLLITVPFVYYLLIRKSKIPVTTVAPVLVIALAIGTYILPVENQYYLNLFKTWALPVVELLALCFIIIKIRQSVNIYKPNKQANPDFFTALKESCAKLLPGKTVPFFATEIAVFYYAFISWRKPVPKENDFTYHKNSGTSTFLAVVIFIVLIETFSVHLLLAKWSYMAAWVLSGLSIYTAVQLFGFLKSLSQRHTSIKKNQLIIRYGILAETEIKLEDIELIELSKAGLKPDQKTKRLSAFGEFESHNVIIKLKKEYVLSGLYGIKKKFTNLALYLDNGEDFKNKIEAILQYKTGMSDEIAE